MQMKDIAGWSITEERGGEWKAVYCDDMLVLVDSSIESLIGRIEDAEGVRLDAITENFGP
jgi:hypothetical protein